jgi:hypothetical protein
MSREKFQEIISALFIILFIYTAISKFINFETFKFQLGRSPFLTKISGLIAWFIPLIELSIAILLLIKKTRLIGLYMSFSLMLLFTYYIYAMLHFSYFVPCSCGGVLSLMSWKQHLLFNILFSLAALSGILIKGQQSKDILSNSIKQNY